MDFITCLIPPMPIFIKGGKASFRIGEKHFQRVFHIFDLIYVVKGSLFMFEEENNYEIKRGEYIILSPGLSHGGFRGCKEDTQYYWAHFSLVNNFQLKRVRELDWSKIVIRESTYTESPRYKLHLPRYGSFRIKERGEQIFQKLVEINDANDPIDKIKQQLIFNEIIIQLQQDVVELPTSAHNVADEAINFIENNYYIPAFTVKEMARQLLYHPDYLSRSMKKVIGMTPTQYLNYYRLSVAKKRLIQENIDLSTVAKECGFSDVSYFSRIFKKREGITPGQYRRMRKSYDKGNSSNDTYR